jgi:DNA-binding transcriptional LysR family regulator
MSILDNTSIFVAVIQQGGFSHAAKHLRLSNGLISRRIALLESELGVTLIKRTTRQLQLTPEGELFWQHAERIQQELNDAINLIHSSNNHPKGTIRISAPFYIGRHYLTPIITKFLKEYNDIKIELDLSNERHDLIKEHFDLIIRGAGFLNEKSLSTSNLRMKRLIKDDIGLYASPAYLQKYGEPKSISELSKHFILSYIGAKKFLEQDKWKYKYKNKESEMTLSPNFRFNDIECGRIACIDSLGIGKFTNLVVKTVLQQKKLLPILQQYHWGHHHLYAVYSNQQSLPQRTRLLLDYIYEQMRLF